MAALAVVIMCMGGLIPVATYVSPMLCAMILNVLLSLCGEKMAWVWYAAVSLLSLLLGPDKEAALVFLFLGHYPIVKLKLDRLRAGRLLKLLLFNGSVCLLYGVMIRLLGMDQVLAEFTEMGMIMLVILILLGNVTFFLLDILLTRWSQMMKHRK